MTKELKPCPFCNNEAMFHEMTKFAVNVHCSNSGICPASVGSLAFSSKELAAKAWNTRHTDPDTVTIKRSELEEMKTYMQVILKYEAINSLIEWRIRDTLKIIESALKGE